MTQMDQEMDARISKTHLGENLVQTIKRELPKDLRTPARQFLMEEAGPIWTQRWAMAMMAMTASMLMILELMLISAQRTKNQIIREAIHVKTVQTETIHASETLANMEAQIMCTRIVRMEGGIALKLTDSLRIRSAPDHVKIAMNGTPTGQLLWIEER